MTTWKQFVAFFLFGSLALSGVALFVVHVDYDHHYTFDREVAEFPRDVVSTNYAELSPEERRVVDRALAGEEVVMQDDDAMPTQGIEKDGRNLLFSYYTSFDWTDPGTFGPTLLGVAGGVGVLATIRADMKNSVVP